MPASRLHTHKRQIGAMLTQSMWLVQVPLSCDLGQIVKQLAHLGCYDGILDLPLRRAAAVDPENAARLPGEAGRAAREVGPACTSDTVWSQKRLLLGTQLSCSVAGHAVRVLLTTQHSGVV